MLARSSVRDLAVALAAIAAAACNSNHKPEADPERLVPLVKTIDKNTPTPGAAPDCTPDHMIGGATMTQVSLLKIEREPDNPGATRQD